MNKKRKWAVIGSVLLVTVLSTATAYFVLAMYYREKFSFGTYINGVYCTGKTVEEVNSLFVEQYTQRKITIVLKDGSTQELVLDKTIFEADFTTALEQIMEKQQRQNPFEWGKRLLIPQYDTIDNPVITYDNEKLSDAIAKLPCTNSAKPEFYLYIGLSEDGYMLMDSTQAFYDPDIAATDIFVAITEGKTFIDLEEEGCYDRSIPVTQEMEAVYQEWEEVESFQNLEINYVFGDSVEPVPDAWMARFLVRDETTGMFERDENGELLIDEDAVSLFIDELADRHDTYGVERKYTTITGKTVTVEGGIYGNKINRREETEWLSETLHDRRQEERVPEYLQKALYQGEDDIGPTYIEVNLTEQRLYYVKDDQIALETDIVSGNLRWGLGTPSRVCYVQGRYRNRVLRGPGYESFVNYWVPVYKNIGIHDATWRNRFGGDIYKTNGSHGCINVPVDQMKILYEELKNGIPVIMYYENTN